jgi:uncharacterized membrane protein (DUF373 family)
MSEDKERPRGMAAIIWTLEHAQDVVSVIVGVMLVALAVVVLILGIVDFFRDIDHGSVETAVVNLLNRVLLVLILVEIMHTVVLSLRAHHLVAQPLLAVGLVAVIRKILFVLSSEGDGQFDRAGAAHRDDRRLRRGTDPRLPLRPGRGRQRQLTPRCHV